MWWRESRPSRLAWSRLAWPVRLAVVLAAAGLTAGCWQPLYGARPVPGGQGVQDKFAAIDIPPIQAPKGTPAERVAVGMFNALQFDLHNGQSVFAPAYQLKVSVGTSQFTAYIDPVSGRPDTQIEIVVASFQLFELTTGKMVLNDITYIHVDYDIPGSQHPAAAPSLRAKRSNPAFRLPWIASSLCSSQ
jgi:LPS-assembly lipoprotein